MEIEMRNYIVICAQAYTNGTGVEIGYNWDRKRFKTREAAIKHGLKTRGSDDFNIGVLDGAKLTDLCWMNEPGKEPPEVLREVANYIGVCAP